MSTTTQTAVRYDRDADGIVTLTLDDPTASANTMNDLYRDGMAAAVDRLYAEQEDVTGVVIASAKKTFFAGGNLRLMTQAGPDDAADVFAGVGEHQVGAAPARAVPAPGRRRDQRRRARRRLRDLPGRQPPHRAGRPEGAARPARVHARPASRRGRRHPRHPDARHPVRADGRAAARHPLQARPGAREGPGRRAGGHSRGAAAGREGVAARAPRRRRRRPEPLGPRGLEDARRHPEQPQAGGVPARLPGPAAQADQGRGLPRAAGDHVRRRRGCADRLRDRHADRVALPDPPDRQPAVEEHDPGVLLRPAGDQRRIAASRGRADVPRHQGRRTRCRDDGRRHRLLLRPRRHGGRAQGRRAGQRREGQGLQREAARQGDRARPLDRGEEGRAARPDHPDRRPGRPRRLRPRHRGGLRGPVAEDQGVRRDRGVRRPRRAAVLQHLDAADHRAGRGHRPPGRLHRAALLLAGRQDAAGRDHPRPRDLRRGAGQGLRRGAADPQDPDRGQRQPRLLHLAGDRHDGQRGPGDAGRGRAPGLAGAGGHAGRLPGRHPPALRRAQHGADEEDPGRHRGGRGARRHHAARAPGQQRSSTR